MNIKSPSRTLQFFDIHILNLVFITVCIWSITDSFYRWIFKRRKNVKLLKHRYLGIHYILAFIGLIFWYFEIGTVSIPYNQLLYFKIFSIILIIIGWILIFWARTTLKNYWTPDVIDVPVTGIVKENIYSIMKHPIYFGEGLLFLGISIFLSNIFVFVFVFIGGTTYNFYRMKIEDSSLRGKRNGK